MKKRNYPDSSLTSSNTDTGITTSITLEHSENSTLVWLATVVQL